MAAATAHEHRQEHKRRQRVFACVPAGLRARVDRPAPPADVRRVVCLAACASNLCVSVSPWQNPVDAIAA